MKIFISYSNDDLKLVKTYANFIKPHAEVKYWDKDKKPGDEVWPMIFQWIDESDIVLAIITDNTVSRAMSVGHEIGRAVTKGKRVIPFVAKGIPVSELGCLCSINYQEIDPENPQAAMNFLLEELAPLKEKKAINWDIILAIGGILLLLHAMSSDSEIYDEWDEY